MYLLLAYLSLPPSISLISCSHCLLASLALFSSFQLCSCLPSHHTNLLLASHPRISCSHSSLTVQLQARISCLHISCSYLPSVSLISCSRILFASIARLCPLQSCLCLASLAYLHATSLILDCFLSSLTLLLFFSYSHSRPHLPRVCNFIPTTHNSVQSVMQSYSLTRITAFAVCP